MNPTEEEIDYLDCSCCGAEFTEREDIDKLEYVRTTASSDHYMCPVCNTEGITKASEG